MVTAALFLLIVLLIFSSGSVFCAAKFNRRYEEILPISCCAVVFILLIFGMADMLKLGVYAVIVGAAALYIEAFSAARGNKDTIRNVFTPAAVLFAMSLSVLIFINYGRNIAYADEFTHWADCAKAMVYADALYTEKSCNAVFATYPPAMALMQYFLQKLYMLAAGTGDWNEWVLYFAYQIFMLAFFFPFFKDISLNRPVRGVVCAGLVLLSPLMMDGSSPFTNLMIDPFLSVVFGCVIAMLCMGNRDRIYDCFIYCGCAVLVLAKAAGMLLAVCAALIYCIDVCSRKDEAIKRKICAAVLAVGVPKVLWSIEVAHRHAIQQFAEKSGAIDPKMLLTLILHRGGDSWQQIIHDEYYTRLLFETVRIKGFQCPYVLMFIGSCVIIYAGAVILHRCKPEIKTAQRVILPIILLFSVIYFVSVCYMYIFKFDRFEAIELASFNRYVGIMLYGVYTAAICIMACAFLNCKKTWWVTGLAIAVFVVLTPFGETLTIARRETIVQSEEMASYIRMKEAVADVTGDDACKVSIICQGSGNVDFFILHYLLRPNSTVKIGESFIGPSPAASFDDRIFTAEEWMKELRDNYDYLALFRLDDYFTDNYSELFVAGSEPEEGAVYAVSTNSLLTKVS